MDILLIDPPYRSLKGMPTDSGYNVGLTSLAAYLRKGDIETAVVMGDLLMDLPTSNKWLGMNVKKYAAGQVAYERILSDDTHIVWKRLADSVRKTKPKAVGIPYLTPLKCVVDKVSVLVKEVDPGIKTVVGSFHPTFCPDEVLHNPNIDFAVRGEGELPLSGLVKELKKDSQRWDLVLGISYRQRDGQVRHNPAADLIENLDELPFLARDLVLNCDYRRYRVHCLTTSRGCPYTCSFCADRRLWCGRVRRRGVENVIRELRLLKDTYRIEAIDFVDGTFTFDRRYLYAFCRAVIDQRLSLKWRCTARYDNLDEESLKQMKQAGCSGLYFGLESGSDRVLQSIDKKMNVAEMVRVSEMVHDVGIPSVTSVLLGLPDEGEEDMAETLRLMKKVKTDIFDINSYVPIPGTPLWDAMSAEKRNIDWRKVGFKSFNNYFSAQVSAEDFKNYVNEAYRIAGRVRNRTIARFAARAVRDWVQEKTGKR